MIFAMMMACAAAAFASDTDRALPVQDYEELTDTKPHDGKEVWEAMPKPVELTWGSVDVRYPKLSIPDVKKTGRMKLAAWKGERVHAQALLWTNRDLDDVTVTVSDLKHGASVIPASAVSTHFVRYVMTDELNKDGKGGCGHRDNKAEWDSLLVADVLDIVSERDIKACSTQPVWVKVGVPRDAKARPVQGHCHRDRCRYEADDSAAGGRCG